MDARPHFASHDFAQYWKLLPILSISFPDYSAKVWSESNSAHNYIFFGWSRQLYQQGERTCSNSEVRKGVIFHLKPKLSLCCGAELLLQGLPPLLNIICKGLSGYIALGLTIYRFYVSKQQKTRRICASSQALSNPYQASHMRNHLWQH